MGNLYQGTENWIYESNNGIKYSIYVGMGKGSKRECNSDIIFIMLDEYWEDDMETRLIDWMYGADFVGKDDDTDKKIGAICEDYEKNHPIVVQELGKERPFIDNGEMMVDFFYCDRREFLNKYGSVRVCDYDATAKIVAKKVASIKIWN